jgi:uracil-DNA glycosylase family 4
MVEYIQRKPFIGPAGKELDALLQECVPATMGYVIVNSLSCTPWENKETKSKIRTPKTSEAKFCTQTNIIPFIERIKPKYIIALGKIANSALTKKVDHLHVIHPSAILQAMHQDYERQKFILSVREYLNASNV